MKYSIAASALAYLFGDVLENVFAGRASRLTRSETLPCREVKVKRRDLAKVMLVAALIHLSEEDHLELIPGKKGHILKSKAVFIALSTEQSVQGPGSLEEQIVSNITGKKKKDDLSSIVWRLLSKDWPNPWSHIIKQTQGYLLKVGYFAEEKRHGLGRLRGKKLVPQCERIATLEREARQLGEMMAAFQARQSELYKQLWKGVTSGIASRQQTADHDAGD